MQTNEPRDNAGGIARNRDKALPHGSKTWADYKGSIRVAGRDYWISGWIVKPCSGHKWLSLAVKPKAEGPQIPPPPEDEKGMGF